jgi:condensin complex subunit 1
MNGNSIALRYTYSRFGVAEQAINAIYLLAAQPDILCGELIQTKTRAVFNKDQRTSPSQETQESQESENSGTSIPGLSSVRSLSQLLFIVGHIASKSCYFCSHMLVKQIIHIELCEAEFKRRKHELEKGYSSLKDDI